MKQSSLDEPLMGCDLEGGEGGTNSGNSEGDNDVMFSDQSSLSQHQGFFEDQNNQPQPRSSIAHAVKDKGKIIKDNFQIFVILEIIENKATNI